MAATRTLPETIVGDDLAGALQGVDEFFYKEGVAFGAGQNGLAEIGRDAAGKQAIEQDAG